MKFILSLIIILSVLLYVRSETTGSSPGSTTGATPSPSSGPAHVYNLFEIRNKQDPSECESHFGNNQTQPFQNVYSTQSCVKGCGGSLKITVNNEKENAYKLSIWSSDENCAAASNYNFELICNEPSKEQALDQTYTVTCQTDNNPPTETPTSTPKNSTDPTTPTPSSTPSNSSAPTNKPQEQATTTGNGSSSSTLIISFALIFASVLSILL